MMRKVDATPYASSLIEGLRDFGYSLETSLADIIDNSITAGAQNIEILADTTGQDPWIAVCDDGKGMSEGELVEAMRPGSKNPLQARGVADLGRFGLGLKSASFSQCRSLTVISRKGGEISCAIWDLDEVAKSNRWEVAINEHPESLPAFEALGEHGTVVLWRKLDRLHGGHTSSELRAKHLNELISGAERHIRLVFHRFMTGNARRVTLRLNGRLLQAIDPFAENNPARQEDPVDTLALPQGAVVIKSVTLPHHKKMSQRDWDEIGGPEGHLRSQGLYIYRADRLIISGGWLGLAKLTEATKLSRVSVDIPNSMDAEWKIDVKKASAQLPAVIRNRLRTTVDRIMRTSKRTYQKRGVRRLSAEPKPVWVRELRNEKIIFRPDLDHPVFADFRERLDPALAREFDACLRVVGASLPIEALHADIIGDANVEKLSADEIPDDALKIWVEQMIQTYSAMGMNGDAVSEQLRMIETLNKNWDRVEKILTQYDYGTV